MLAGDAGQVVVGLQVDAAQALAVGLELEGGAIKEARFALGGVAHKPWRNTRAEAALRGRAASEATFVQAADLVLGEAKGFGHNTFKIDLARRAIVRALSQDGRMSYTDLGKLTGLSTSAVHHRVRRLEQRGVLRGYRAVVDATSLGLPLTAFISLTPLDQSAPDDVPQRLEDLVEVEAIHAVAGEANYMIKVRVDSPATLEELQSFSWLPDNVAENIWNHLHRAG